MSISPDRVMGSMRRPRSSSASACAASSSRHCSRMRCARAPSAPGRSAGLPSRSAIQGWCPRCRAPSGRWRRRRQAADRGRPLSRRAADHRRFSGMRYLHTMLRVRDLDAALDFYCNKLGLKEVRRRVDDKNRYTLVFLAGPHDEKLVETSKRDGRDAPLVELTYNWDTEDYGEARYFGHLAYEVDDIYAIC